MASHYRVSSGYAIESSDSFGQYYNAETLKVHPSFTTIPVATVAYYARTERESDQQYLPDRHREHLDEMSRLVDGGEMHSFSARPPLPAIKTDLPTTYSPLNPDEKTPVDQAPFSLFPPWDVGQYPDHAPSGGLFDYDDVDPSLTQATAVDHHSFSPLSSDISSPKERPLFSPSAPMSSPVQPIVDAHTINGLHLIHRPSQRPPPSLPILQQLPQEPAASDEGDSSTTAETDNTESSPPPENPSNEDEGDVAPPTDDAPNSGSPESEAPSNSTQIPHRRNIQRRKRNDDEEYMNDEEDDDEYRPARGKRRRAGDPNGRSLPADDLKCRWEDNEQPCTRTFKKKYELERHVFEQHSVIEAKRVAQDPTAVYQAPHYAADVIKSILTSKSPFKSDTELVTEARAALQTEKKWYDDGSSNVPIHLEGNSRLIKFLQDEAHRHRIFKCNRCHVEFSAERSLQRHVGHQNCTPARDGMARR